MIVNLSFNVVGSSAFEIRAEAERMATAFDPAAEITSIVVRPLVFDGFDPHAVTCWEGDVTAIIYHHDPRRT